MLIDINVRKLDQLIQAMVFQATVDVSGTHNPELQEEWLSIAEDLIEQTGGDNSPAMHTEANRVLEYNHELKPEDFHLKNRILKILNDEK